MLLHYDHWLSSFHVIGNDEEFGTVHDVYFDEDHWTVRYLVVKAGTWFTGEKLFLSPASITNIDMKEEKIYVNISKEQAKDAPQINEQPVTRKSEREFSLYYSLGPYWLGSSLWGNAIAARELAKYEPEPVQIDDVVSKEDYRPYVHRAEEIIGYELSARGDSFGKIEDLLIEEDSYKIRYFVCDTKKILPGKKILISTDWITNIDWTSKQIHINVEREEVENAPEYLKEPPLTRDMEEELFMHYGKKGYWKS
ncbi:PRC-barrel domain-containing protein [Bacillus shivajii]|uniref:PRC-barrel domain containing protein n=1 Tax=Bacillus shivajii TaxID=1983719 RepID=UPI001CF9D734|nr:PRC-barrel domain-containing protein [Bacillus shivajii]UCZ54409.1 PRC-barrel domain-containing protein [Bacillus shivajii]